jgi:hypothetical protein
VFDFYELFSMCPNLEKFVFSGSQFIENTLIPISADNFKMLETVDISMFDSQGYQFPLPIAEHILRAENLNVLRLYWAKCFPRALANVLAENNDEHFKNLNYLNLERIWVKNYRGYIKNLKRLICRAPYLSKLEIGCVNQGVEEFKKSGLKQFCQKIHPYLELLTDYDDGMFAF